MKITKRLSLLSTIDHRIAAPKPKSTFIDRYLYNLRDEKQMNV